MTDSRNQPELETLDYKPTVKKEDCDWPVCTCDDFKCPEKPASAPPATLGMNSHVIKPEHSECEHNWLDRGFIVEKCSKCGALNTTQDTINKTEDVEQPKCEKCGNPQRKDRNGWPIQYCGKPCPPSAEPPNLKIIGEIEGLISQVNEKLCKITTLSGEGRLTVRRTQLKGQALEEIDIFQKTTLFELRKAFED
ncbi:MAG TPA: hypothetical protein ENH82_12090 [bacterium]|nr:hypothetical protein [bacterium]